MEFLEAASQLYDISGSVFIKTEPEVLDFTNNASGKLVVYDNIRRIELEVTPDNIMSICGLLDATILDKSRVERLYAWDLKSFCSYVRFFVKKFLSPTNSVIDLKVIENFLGLKQKCPQNLSEVVNRMKVALQCCATPAGAAQGMQQVYKSIHLPLILRVLPFIETIPLLNEATREAVYPFYEIEGQVNGRMNCAAKFAHSYVPHLIRSEVAAVLKPYGYGTVFLTADFRHCEVAVLQYLSNDKNLKSIIESGEDVYRKIYEIVTDHPCDTKKKRDLCKEMFLPVMYGCGPKGLAKNINCSEEVGKKLYVRIARKFSTALSWMLGYQIKAKAGEVITDYFGRPRQYTESYKVRNFLVQAVAATICQEKLIGLYNALDNESAYIAFSVHDGYSIITKASCAKETYQKVKQILEAESKLCPGLKMKTEIKFGAKLDKMKVLWK